MLVASVIGVIIVYVLGCFPQVARRVPINYILLFIFAICQSYTVSFIASQYDATTVLMAAGLTLAIVIALTIYAATTRSDFTTCGGVMIVLGVAIMVGGIIGLFVRNRWLQLGLSIAGVIVFGMYLVYDTQLVVGNQNRRYQMDDYIFAAMGLYINIIQIFVSLLQILGQFQRE